MPTSRDRWLPFIYAAAIFLSAFLLFQIQPLVSKRILPWFGGSPSVWTTCLLFFQTSLFAGYAYAHWSATRLKPAQQAAVHIGLIVLAVALLPAIPGDRWEPAGGEQPIGRILLILTVSIGIPYFVLSATGPLLQAWFVRTYSDRVPYRLYALSNVGSLVALLSFPFVFEPMFHLHTQAVLWSCGFIMYAALCAYIGWRIRTSEPSPAGRGQGEGGVPGVEAPPSPQLEGVAGLEVQSQLDQPPGGSQMARPQPPRDTSPPSATQRFLWLILSAFGSLTLLATTNHISADIAAVPLLWIVPLSLYLVTFIIAFDRPAWYRPAPVAALVIVSVYAAAAIHKLGLGESHLDEITSLKKLYSYFVPHHSSSPSFSLSTRQLLAVNFVSLFSICMLCHGELVCRRPAPKYLTSFYLMIAAGGALGGVLIILIAPQIFKTYLEWDASLAIAAVAAIGILARTTIAAVIRNRWFERCHASLALGMFTLATLALVLVSVGLAVDLSEFLFSSQSNVIWRARNFFGALAVEDRAVLDDDEDNETREFLLVHGAITHGSQFADESRRREPTTYYGRESGVGRAIEFYHKHLPTGRLCLGAVGLGAGTLAAYPDAGESITFYEINPVDIDIAEHHPWFTYLHDCRQRGAKYDIRLGDARLSLKRELASASPPHSKNAPSGPPPRSENSPSGPPPRSGEGLGEGRPQQPPNLAPYHILILDAFSGDSIPVHLLTVEAFKIYLARITGSTLAAGKPDEAGAIAVHISNRYLDLEPVVRAAASQYGLDSSYISNDDDDANGVYNSDWIILTYNRTLSAALKQYTSPPENTGPPVTWTDSHTSLFEVLR